MNIFNSYVITAGFMSKSYGEGRNIFSTSTISYNSQVAVQPIYRLRGLHSVAADTYNIRYVDYTGTEQSLRTVQKYHWRYC